MSNLNRVLICGRLGGDPELKYSQSNTAICNLNVATSERWKDKDGNQQEETEWSRIVCFSKQAENCAKYLAKGSLVFVEGKLRTRSWDDKETGAKRYATEIIANNIQFLSSTNKDGVSGNQNPAPEHRPNNDDVPF